KVYLTLLELGSSTTGPIIDESEVSSSKVYEILEKLIDKGLVSYVLEGKVKQFEAASPKRIFDYIDERKAQLEKQKDDIKDLLPSLMAKRKGSKYKSEATIYRGKRALKTVFNESLDMLKDGGEVHGLGIPKRSDVVNRFFMNWTKRRVKMNIKEKLLFDETARSDPQSKTKNRPMSEIRWLPKNMITPASIDIFNDRVVLFPAETGDEILLIVIDSKEVAASFEAQFQLSWKISKK
ncbi:MAG: hypothetical protein KKC05_02770, partial [Nanoarchaeota archaeon]|nr:hypothetical protein [Nanoarchaeota archaeon]